MNIKHGHAAHSGPSREWNTWRSMKGRCLNPKDPAFDRYGGRGITVCQRWQDSFMVFLQDMGPRPLGTSIDRIDCNGNYEPGNCRWATSLEQNQNLRPWVTCKRGHVFTIESAYIRPSDGRRRCRLCIKIYKEKYAKAS